MSATLVHLGVKVPKHVKTALVKLARADRRTVSDYVRGLIEVALECDQEFKAGGQRRDV